MPSKSFKYQIAQEKRRGESSVWQINGRVEWKVRCDVEKHARTPMSSCRYTKGSPSWSILTWISVPIVTVRLVLRRKWIIPRMWQDQIVGTKLRERNSIRHRYFGSRTIKLTLQTEPFDYPDRGGDSAPELGRPGLFGCFKKNKKSVPIIIARALFRRFQVGLKTHRGWWETKDRTISQLKLGVKLIMLDE